MHFLWILNKMQISILWNSPEKYEFLKLILNWQLNQIWNNMKNIFCYFLRGFWMSHKLVWICHSKIYMSYLTWWMSNRTAGLTEVNCFCYLHVLKYFSETKNAMFLTRSSSFIYFTFLKWKSKFSEAMHLRKNVFHLFQ